MSRTCNLLSWRVIDAFIVLCFIGLAYANVLQIIFGGSFSYIDEALTFLLGIMGICSSRMEASDKEGDWRLLACLFALCAVGITGNFVYSLQASWTNVAIDILACSRFFIMYCFASRISYEPQRVLRACSSIAKVSLVVFTAFMIVNQLVDIGMSEDVRYGIRSFRFLFGHPTNFSAAIVGFVAVILSCDQKPQPYCLLAIVLLCSSMRFKSIGFAFVLFAMTFLYRGAKRLPISFFIVAGMGALLLAFDQFELYFGNEGSARSVLLNTSFDVANQFFPFGSGFATYGSNASAEPYLDFYYQLGFDKVYGLMPLEHSYLVDSFWPIVIGQFGYLGLVIFLMLLALFCIQLRKAVSTKRVQLWAVLAIPIYLLISSTSEASFFSTYAAYLGFSMAIIFSGRRGYGQIMDYDLREKNVERAGQEQSEV